MTPARFKQIRKDFGLTQAQLAEVLRLAPVSGKRTVRDWETGRRPITGPAALAMELLVQVLKRDE